MKGIQRTTLLVLSVIAMDIYFQKVSSTTASAVSSTTAHAGSSATAPAVSSSTAPAVSSATAHAGSSTTAPAVSSTTTHAVSSTTAPGVTQTVTTALPNIYPSHEPNWGTSNISIPLTIFVKSIYPPELDNRTSTMYQSYTKAFTKTLKSLYRSIIGFQGVNITGFVNGSIGCRFVVLVAPSNANPINTTQLLNNIKEVGYANATFNVSGKGILRVESNKTNNAIEEALKQNYFEEALQKTCIESNVCPYDSVCVVNKQHFICTHKCNANNICSKNGECYVDNYGNVECRCKKDSTYVYNGHTCKDKVLVFFNGTNTTIIGACAGAVIALLLLLVIYLGARWRHKRMSEAPDEKLSDPEELRKDNFHIENVPMGGVGKTNPMYRPDKSDPHGEGYNNHYVRERLSRESVYEDEMAYDEGRYYRVLKDPENRSKAYVYQPSNMSIPEQRTSTASKFDDLDSKPLSYHLRPEKEQQFFHDIVGTEQPYSIRRPQIMRSTVNSNGYR